MNLTDDKQFNLDGIGQQKIWADLGLQPCHEFGGVAIFQAAIGILLTEWSRRWVAALDQITAALGDEVRHSLLSGWPPTDVNIAEGNPGFSGGRQQIPAGVPRCRATAP